MKLGARREVPTCDTIGCSAAGLEERMGRENTSKLIAFSCKRFVSGAAHEENFGRQHRKTRENKQRKDLVPSALQDAPYKSINVHHAQSEMSVSQP